MPESSALSAGIASSRSRRCLLAAAETARSYFAAVDRAFSCCLGEARAGSMLGASTTVGAMLRGFRDHPAVAGPRDAWASDGRGSPLIDGRRSLRDSLPPSDLARRMCGVGILRVWLHPPACGQPWTAPSPEISPRTTTRGRTREHILHISEHSSPCCSRSDPLALDP